MNHPPHLDPLLNKGYATIHRHPDGTETVRLTERTLHPAHIRDVYAETVRYFRSLETERRQSAQAGLMRTLESFSYGRLIALSEEITDRLTADEPAELERMRTQRRETEELRRDLRALVSAMPQSELRTNLERLLGPIS